MKIFEPSSAAVAEIAFDPNKTFGMVYIRYANGNTTYRYDSWPLSGLKTAVAQNSGLGGTINHLKKKYGGSFESFEGDVATAIRQDRHLPWRAPSLYLNDSAGAVLAF